MAFASLVAAVALFAFSPISPEVLFRFLFDGEFPAIESAFGTDPVIEHGRAAVGACSHGRYRSLVVGSSLVAPRGRDFVFRMCHIYYCKLLNSSSVTILNLSSIAGLHSGCP